MRHHCFAAATAGELAASDVDEFEFDDDDDGVEDPECPRDPPVLGARPP